MKIQEDWILTDKVEEVIKRATSLAVLIRHGNKVRGRDAKWPQSGGREGTRGNAYILERGGGNDPLPCHRVHTRKKPGWREGEKRVVREHEREDSLFVGGDMATRRPRWNRMVAVTQLRRVSVYTAVVGGKHQRHVG